MFMIILQIIFKQKKKLQKVVNAFSKGIELNIFL